MVSTINHPFVDLFCGEADGDNISNFWDVLIPIFRLDKKNPTQAWKKHIAELRQRSKLLNEAELSWLHFKGPGTDLKVHLSPKSIWCGGGMTTVDNRYYLPNLPTEEVYTTPDFRKTEGRVSVTRPLKIFNQNVERAWFEFNEGKVVDYGAEKGKEVLKQYFKADPRAMFLGEVALVDVNSPIYRSGKVFDSILLDENAASHIALGRGIPFAIQNGTTLAEDALEKLGCNNALLHTDFMIGTSDMNVTGRRFDGSYIDIIKAGRFVI